MLIVRGGGGEAAPSRRKRNNSLIGTKTETREHQTDYCPAFLLLFGGRKKVIKDTTMNMPHM